MSAIEKTEKNKVKLTFEVSPERFAEGLKFSYNKNRGRTDVSGFRKGKAPRRVIENVYGKEFFYDDAIHHVLPDAYQQVLEEHGVEPVAKPELNLDRADEAEGLFFTAEVYVKPEVEIDGYLGLTYLKQDTEPGDDDIQSRIQQEREKNARISSVERPAEMGDIAVINFTGYLDGEPFAGGSGKDHELTLGSHQFIDTFEEQLVGHVPGDETEVNVVFPEDYRAENLAGKAVVFKVEILDIKTKELPELNDEFAQDVSEFETMLEYRADLHEKIKKEKESNALIVKRSGVMEQLVQKAVMEVPEVMYESKAEEMVDELNYRLSSQRLNMEMYLKFNNITEEQLKERYAVQAKQEVDGKLALEAVAKKEGIEISQEEFEAHITKISETSNYSAEELISRCTPERKKEIMQELLYQKALDFVADNAVASDKPPMVVNKAAAKKDGLPEADEPAAEEEAPAEAAGENESEAE
ncbi:MAG: trigger factor [Defluviitaleaceae bacterium]|nr:trigger factor [Defluviitaleaceae bacterium]